MKREVVLSILGRQSYQGQEPEQIELLTEGTLEYRDGGWDLCYEESSLTGLDGVLTTFRVEPEQILLTRTGKLNSQMIFKEGVSHDSLYQVDVGALMITVCASRIFANISERGGVIDLVYSIEIEQTAAGTIDYHLQIDPKE